MMSSTSDMAVPQHCVQATACPSPTGLPQLLTEDRRRVDGAVVLVPPFKGPAVLPNVSSNPQNYMIAGQLTANTKLMISAAIMATLMIMGPIMLSKSLPLRSMIILRRTCIM